MKIIYKKEDNIVFFAYANIILFNNMGICLDENNNVVMNLSNLYCNGDFEVVEVEELPEDFKNEAFNYKYIDGEFVKI